MKQKTVQNSPRLLPALAGAFCFLTIVRSYKRYLHEHVRPNFIDRDASEKDRRRHFDILLDESSIIPLAIIWNYSDHLQSPQTRQRLFKRKNSDRAIMTQQMLGEALQHADLSGMSFSSSQMYVQRARRLVEAATAYGLVEIQENSRSNLKPLVATIALHALMTEILPPALPFEDDVSAAERLSAEYIEKVEKRAGA